MKRIINLLFLSMVLVLNSQEQKQSSDYSWFKAKYVKFKPGKASKARDLLTKYLYKANEISGRLVITFESDTGDWDHIAYLHLKDGPQQVAYDNDEIETKWWNGVLQLAGSEKKAKEIINEYQSYVLKEKHNLVKMRDMHEQLSRQ